MFGRGHFAGGQGGAGGKGRGNGGRGGGSGFGGRGLNSQGRGAVGGHYGPGVNVPAYGRGATAGLYGPPAPPAPPASVNGPAAMDGGTAYTTHISLDGSNVVTLDSNDVADADCGKAIYELTKRRRATINAKKGLPYNATHLASPMDVFHCLWNGNIFTNPCPKGAGCPGARYHGEPPTVTPLRRAQFLHAAGVHFRK